MDEFDLDWRATEVALAGVPHPEIQQLREAIIVDDVDREHYLDGQGD